MFIRLSIYTYEYYNIGNNYTKMPLDRMCNLEWGMVGIGTKLYYQTLPDLALSRNAMNFKDFEVGKETTELNKFYEVLIDSTQANFYVALIQYTERNLLPLQIIGTRLYF